MTLEETRTKFTVCVFPERGITEVELGMIERAMEYASLIYGCPVIMGSQVEGLDIRPDEITGNAPLDSKGRSDSRSILDGMQYKLKSYGLKGAMVLYTSKDLYLGNTWCFGAARVGGGVTVQSVTRYSALPPDDKQAVITRTLIHELGHIHRLAASRKRPETAEKFGNHCTAEGCVMRQSPTLKDLIRHAKEEDPKNCLCSLCKADLERFKYNYY